MPWYKAKDEHVAYNVLKKKQSVINEMFISLQYLNPKSHTPIAYDCVDELTSIPSSKSSPSLAHATYFKWQSTYVGGNVVIIVQQLCHHGIRDYAQQ